ncbi:MAG: MMPL family transporter [Gemmatimonadota bacterium]|nr:MAG: MMPL family transporter [Gemmatimonadota bacterium]
MNSTTDSTNKDGRLRRWLEPLICMGLGAAAVLVVLVWIDLSPRVESDFFFSRDDPQLRALRDMEQRFPSPEQILLRVAGPDIGAEGYLTSLSNLSADLAAIPGVVSVNSVATENVTNSPLWQRLLLNPGDPTTNIIIQIPDPDPATLVPYIESVVDRYAAPDFALEVSGVPFIVELIRRHLFRDLMVFSLSAFVIFGLLVGAVYRNLYIVLGTLTSCLTACAVTLSVAHLLDIAIGLLTANIAVIVFVLTLSHIVFLTSNWRQRVEESRVRGVARVREAVQLTFGASFWCMLTTLLGFLSLLVATARPLRELGMAGAIGTVTAIAVAYGIYPAFLRGSVGPEPQSSLPVRLDIGARLPRRNATRWLGAIGAVALLAALGLRHLSTDPSLLSYFAPGTELRDGLEAIDQDGGSSPLNMAVEDPEGHGIDSDEMNAKMWTLQRRLESDPSVGVTISPALLLAEARLAPFGGLMNWSQLLDILESPVLDRVGLSFVTPDRQQGRFFLRMRESGRTEPRFDIVTRVTEHVSASGLEADLVAGHYELQGQLGRLIAASLRIGLGGLLLLFVGIAFIVSRSPGRTLAMVVCLCCIPLIVLGTAGHVGMPIDIITSPAANVALAMGVDSMIHLVIRMRRLRPPGTGDWEAWLAAREQLWKPILGATLIICAGFGIFSLSSFPPTQRFGYAVILGTLTAATMALVALPFAATTRLRVKNSQTGI